MLTTRQGAAGGPHQHPGGDLELQDDDGEEEEAQDEQGGGDAVDDVRLQAAEDHAGAGDGGDDGADALLRARRVSGVRVRALDAVDMKGLSTTWRLAASTLRLVGRLSNNSACNFGVSNGVRVVLRMFCTARRPSLS
jgi:hypothetical protein